MLVLSPPLSIHLIFLYIFLMFETVLYHSGLELTIVQLQEGLGLDPLTSACQVAWIIDLHHQISLMPPTSLKKLTKLTYESHVWVSQ